ncbi:MAG: UDP-N-acetylmuramate dehydrogenase [Candidatus Omnitrophica bacterium]|nr:UDP-N-acetylmuramate dehydrogenase [Candidatus Omnitrophota bacterium]MDD5355245.1 UDP-N-acetylmuramate dehydrogenase [Candidatus Omnitrophota bacterium]
MKWSARLKGKLKFKEPLKKYSNFKIGGEASVLFEPQNTNDLINCLVYAKKNKIPYFVIGNGTNVLISDKGFKGVVIRLASPYFKRISIKNNIVTAGAGLGIKDLIRRLLETNLSGYEFLTGIPASIGGALVMNAGVTKEGKRFSICDIVYKVKVLNKKGKVFNIARDKIKFNYRRSGLDKYIVLGAQLKLNKGKKSDIEKRIKDYLCLRRQRQDYSKPNIGCIFRNPSVYLSAGMLIDKCGFKGRHCGGAMVSKKHANFILNFNRAKASDVIKLMETIKKKVRNNFDISLREEIKLVS